jgi:hypothetical protein
MPARIIRHRVSKEVWTNYTKFCVERNPWDRTLSHYYMLKHYVLRERGDEAFSVDDYLDNGEFCHNLPIYADSDGKILVDRVLRYENLANDLADMFGSLGVPFDGDLGCDAKSEYRPNRKPYPEVLSAIQIRRLRDIFKNELALHNN